MSLITYYIYAIYIYFSLFYLNIFIRIIINNKIELFLKFRLRNLFDFIHYKITALIPFIRKREYIPFSSISISQIFIF